MDIMESIRNNFMGEFMVTYLFVYASVMAAAAQMIVGISNIACAELFFVGEAAIMR